MKSRHELTEHLCPLHIIDHATLVRVAGGEMASTSTSGTPKAGDDTIGDRSGRGGGFYQMHDEGA